MKEISVFQQPKTVAEIDLGSRFQQSVFLAKLGFRNDGSGSANDGRHDMNDKEGRTIEEKEVFVPFFNSKPTTKNGFEQTYNCTQSAVNPASPRTGVRRNSAKKFEIWQTTISGEIRIETIFFVFKTDFQNRF